MFNDLDVYLHTWNKLDVAVNWRGQRSELADVDTPVQAVAKALHAVRYRCESMEKEEFNRPSLDNEWGRSGTRPFHVLAQWYGVWRAWSMVEDTGVANYDIVIRARLDVEARFNVASDYERGVVVGERRLPWARRCADRMMCDCHAYGAPSFMRIYAAAYLNAENLLRRRECGRLVSGKHILCPEIALRKQLGAISVIKDPAYMRILRRVSGETVRL